ncbi:MAG: hypothetical protein JRH20_20180 [Deltaproteobacteria bacterium]|nr:hypothetical protein [Deltaproteobacteria bacterium]
MLGRFRFPFKGSWIELIDRPGDWMSDTELSTLRDRLIDVMVSRVGETLNPGYFSTRRDMSARLVLIASRGGQDTCFTAMAYAGRYQGRLVLHSGLTVSLQEARGMMQWLYAFGTGYVIMKQGFRRVWCTSITHTPRIYGSFVAYYRDVFPNLDPTARPKDFHIAIRDKVVNDYARRVLGAEKPPEIDGRFVLPGLRAKPDGGLFLPVDEKTVAQHRDPKVNKRVAKLLDYARGDDVLQVGWLAPVAIMEAMFRGGFIRKG